MRERNPMDIQQIYIDYQKIVKAMLALPDSYIRLSDQNAPKVAVKDYAIVTPLSITDKGSHKRKLTPQAIDFKETVGSSQLKVTLMLQFYGDSASRLASKLQQLVNSTAYQRAMHQAKLGHIRIDSINLPAALMNETYNNRAAVQVEFYTQDYYDLNVNEIDLTTLSIDGQIASPKSNFTVDKDTPIKNKW